MSRKLQHMRQHSRQIYRLKAPEARFRLTISYIFLTFWTYVGNAFKKYISFFINGENKQQLAARLVPFDTFANATKLAEMDIAKGQTISLTLRSYQEQLGNINSF